MTNVLFVCLFVLFYADKKKIKEVPKVALIKKFEYVIIKRPIQVRKSRKNCIST